jgi:hypothetical protein
MEGHATTARFLRCRCEPDRRRGPESAADFDDKMRGREKCLRNRGRETLNRPIPARLAAPWTKIAQNWAKTLPRETR